MNYSRSKGFGMTLFIVLLLTPIYWLLNMSFKTNQEILGGLTLWPQNFTLANYAVIFSDSSWYSGYINSMIYVSMNMTITLLVALPAAYAFSRYKFVGDKHLFFWLYGPPSSIPAALLSALFVSRAVRYPHCGGACALPVQRAAGGLDSGRFHVGCAARVRRDGLY